MGRAVRGRESGVTKCWGLTTGAIPERLGSNPAWMNLIRP